MGSSGQTSLHSTSKFKRLTTKLGFLSAKQLLPFARCVCMSFQVGTCGWHPVDRGAES